MKPLTLLKRIAFCALAAGSIFTRAAETTLFTDDFEGDTSAKWTVREASGDNVPDYTVEWNFDYTLQKTNVASTGTIPLAPNSSAGASHGVKMTVNKNVGDPVTSATALAQIFAKDQSFSGNFALRFDMWINYNGPAYGGTGSTEHAIFGINHNNQQAEWPSSNPSSGIFFAVTGEGGAGATGDYVMYEGAADNTPLRQTPSEVFIDHDNEGTVDYEVSATAVGGLGFVFPAGQWHSPGMPGKRWVQVEVRQQDGVVTWVMNRVVIARRANPEGSPWTAGTVMLGTMDIFASVASPKEENFAIFDNVRVVDLGTDPAKPQISVTTSFIDAAEPNVNGEFTITRTGDTTADLAVALHSAGAATSGTDYQALPATVTISAGSESVTVPVTVIDDFFGEPVETVQLVLDTAPNYEIVAMAATANITDDGDVPQVSIAINDAVAFEGLQNEAATFVLSRIGDTSGDLEVTLALSGSATSGTDYEAVAVPFVIPAGLASATLKINALADAVADDNETIIVTVTDAAAYNVSPTASSASATIREVTQLFTDDFESSEDAANYTILFNAAGGADDYTADFSFDFSAVTAIEPQPAGSTKGLKLTANKDASGNAAAINVFTKDQSFSGDYLMNVDMFLTYNTVASGTTEHTEFGVGMSGTLPARFGVAGDGVWFAVETDASSQTSRGGTYAVFTGGTTFFAGRPSSAYTSIFTVGDGFQTAGSVAGNWVDVSVLSLNGHITMKINDVLILELDAPAGFGAGKVMLGYADTFTSIGSPDNYVIYDNLAVYRIGSAVAPPTLGTPTISLSGANVVIKFTAQNANTLEVFGAADVAGTFTKVTTATVNNLGGGNYEAVVPATGAAQFFKIKAQ